MAASVVYQGAWQGQVYQGAWQNAVVAAPGGALLLLPGNLWGNLQRLTGGLFMLLLVVWELKVSGGLI